MACQRRSVSSARQLDDAGPAEVHVQSPVFDINARPDDLARLGDPLQRAAAQWENTSRGCRSLAAPVQPPMKCAGGAEPLIKKHPHVVVDRAGAIPIAPAQIVQRVFDRLAHRLVNAIGHQPVEPGALVDFVEVRQRLAFVQHALAVAAA